MVLEQHFSAVKATSCVLILLWVEYGLGGLVRGYYAEDADVLILLWVEYGLGGGGCPAYGKFLQMS